MKKEKRFNRDSSKGGWSVWDANVTAKSVNFNLGTSGNTWETNYSHNSSYGIILFNISAGLRVTGCDSNGQYG